MKKTIYKSMNTYTSLDRREFMKLTGAAGSLIGAGFIIDTPLSFGQDKRQPPERPKTNIDEATAVPRTKNSLPGAFPGKVVEVHDEKAMIEDRPSPDVIEEMFERGITKLTGKNLKKSCRLLFEKDDVVGIKVNPVGAGLISTRLEVVDAAIDWLEKGGIKRQNIIIWDRFDYMLRDAGFTSERYPGIGIEGLQSMDPDVFEGKEKEKISVIDENGRHISEDRFDMDVYYWADVDGPKDPAYLNQHVFNGKHSYYGKLLTKKLTKMINIPVFKNTGNGISMATKNIGYGAVCNTNRLHKPLFFDVNVEVHAFPVIRDKLVLNITDGLRGQYEGGPGPAAKFCYTLNKLYFATDPFALDLVCHNEIVEKRKAMSINVNEHPRYTDYFRYAQKLGLGIADPEKIDHIKA